MYACAFLASCTPPVNPLDKHRQPLRQRCSATLAGLCSNESLVPISARHELHGVRKGAGQRIGESNGEAGRQKIDIKLEVALGINPVNPQNTTAAV